MSRKVEDKKVDVNLPSSNNIYLNVLSGTQRGASVVLTEGRKYTLGTDITADIVLFDESILPEHLTLKLEGNVVQLIARDDLVAINGQRLPPDVQRLHPVDFSLAIGDVELRDRKSVV